MRKYFEAKKERDLVVPDFSGLEEKKADCLACRKPFGNNQSMIFHNGPCEFHLKCVNGYIRSCIIKGIKI